MEDSSGCRILCTFSLQSYMTSEMMALGHSKNSRPQLGPAFGVPVRFFQVEQGSRECDGEGFACGKDARNFGIS